MSALTSVHIAPAAKAGCPARRTSAPRARASIRVLAKSRQNEAVEAKLPKELTGALMAAAMATSFGLSAAPPALADDADELRAMLSKYKTAPVTKAAPVTPPPVVETPAPAAPAPAPVKPAPAPKVSNEMPSFSFSMPETPAAPTPPPAPVPQPRKAAPPKAPEPAPVKKAEPKKPEAKKQTGKSKRKGPLPPFFAELLMGGVLAGVGLAGTKYSSETQKASEAAGKVLIKSLTEVEKTLKGN